MLEILIKKSPNQSIIIYNYTQQTLFKCQNVYLDQIDQDIKNILQTAKDHFSYISRAVECMAEN